MQIKNTYKFLIKYITMAQDGNERRKTKRDKMAKGRYNIYKKGGKHRTRKVKDD